VIVVALFFSVVGAGMVTWYVLLKRRVRAEEGRVTDRWVEAHRYKRNGDIPPGTSRQEEGK